MNAIRSRNCSSSLTNDAREIPYDASSFTGFTKIGNFNCRGRPIRCPRGITTKFGVRTPWWPRIFFEMPLCLQSVSPVDPQPVNGTPCISSSETMFWSNPGLFLNCSTRLKRTSGAKLSIFCRTRSRSSKMARCSAVWPSVPSAAITFASVFQSSCFISLVRSSSILVGRVPSKRTRTLSFFFTLFGALELAGEEIIHHQRRDECGDPKILLRIVVVDVEPELIAAVDEPGEKFVHPELFLIRPLAHGVHQPPSSQAQITTRFQS